MAKMEFKIFENYEVKLGWMDGVKFKDRTSSIKWDAKRTKVTRAEAYVKAETTCNNTRLTVKMNDNIIADFIWAVAQPAEKREEVTGILINGDNKFRLEVSKFPVWFPVELSVFVTLSIIIEYEPVEGDGWAPPPEVREWWDKVVEFVSENKVPLAIAGAGVFTGGVALATRRK